jgi:hypothetical protein
MAVDSQRVFNTTDNMLGGCLGSSALGLTTTREDVKSFDQTLPFTSLNNTSDTWKPHDYVTQRCNP